MDDRSKLRFQVGVTAGKYVGYPCFQVLDVDHGLIICKCFERVVADTVTAALNDLAATRPAVLMLFNSPN